MPHATPVRFAGGRIPSLDGLRALSIAIVIASHLVPRIAAFGDFGVSVFFVISGFLITWLLVMEQERTGRIDLVAFYRRRAYRIWPAFYAMVAVAALLAATRVIALPWHDVLTAATFTYNYVPTAGDGWWLGHSWSLAVEEQFYLLWPAAMLLLGVRRARWLAIAILAAAPLARVATWLLLSEAQRPMIGVMLHTRADSLMAGCALALVLATPRGAALVGRAVASWLPAASALFLVAVAPPLRELAGPRYLVPGGWTIEAVAIAIVLAAVVLRPGTAAGRLLNGRLATAIGVRSFSLYLWQQFFLHEVPGVGPVPVPLRIVLTLAAAELSYRFVEQPVLALRARRERRAAVVRPPVGAVERTPSGEQPRTTVSV